MFITPCVRNSTGSTPTGQTLARPFGRFAGRGDEINVELTMRGSFGGVGRYNIQPYSSQLRRLPFVKQHFTAILHQHTYFLPDQDILRPTHSQPHQHTTISQHCPTMAPHAENVTGVASDGKEVPVNPGEAPLEPGIKKNIAQGQMIAFPS